MLSSILLAEGLPAFEKITPIAGVVLECENIDSSDCNEQAILDAANYIPLQFLSSKRNEASHLLAYKHREKIFDWGESWDIFDFKLINLETSEIEFSTSTINKFHSKRPSHWTIQDFFSFLGKHAIKK